MKIRTAVVVIAMMTGCASMGGLPVNEVKFVDTKTAPVIEAGANNKVNPVDLQKTRELFEEGMRQINSFPQSAIEAFTEVIRLSPTTWEAHYNSALAYIKMRDFKKAEGELIKSLNKKAPAAKIYSVLGIVYLYTGKRENAIAALQASLAIEKTAAALINLAGLYHSDGQTDKAIGCIREAETLEPADNTLHYKIGLLWYSMGRYKRAWDALEKAAGNGNKDKRVMRLKVQTLLKQGNYDDSLKVLREMSAFDTSDLTPYRDMGIIYELYLGDLDKAAKSYNVYMYAKDRDEEEAKKVKEWMDVANARLSQEKGKNGD